MAETGEGRQPGLFGSLFGRSDENVDGRPDGGKAHKAKLPKDYKKKKEGTDSTTDHAAGDTPWRKLGKEEQKRTGR